MQPIVTRQPQKLLGKSSTLVNHDFRSRATSYTTRSDGNLDMSMSMAEAVTQATNIEYGNAHSKSGPWRSSTVRRANGAQGGRIDALWIIPVSNALHHSRGSGGPEGPNRGDITAPTRRSNPLYQDRHDSMEISLQQTEFADGVFSISIF
jgi:hypothetical protein